MTADDVRAMTDEIESLRAAIAVKDEALTVALGEWKRAACNGDDDETEKAMHIAFYEAALSSTPPSGMVCVPVERLREIAINDRMECPVCGTPCEYGHAPDCWLAAAIKEADDE